MNRKLTSLLIINILVLLPFGFFFYRDVTSNWNSAQGIDGCIPYDVTEEAVGKDFVRYAWKTKEDCISYLRVSKNPGEVGELIVGDAGLAPSKVHHSLVTELRPNSTYYVLFYAEEEEYGLKGEPLSFTTKNF